MGYREDCTVPERNRLEKEWVAASEKARENGEGLWDPLMRMSRILLRQPEPEPTISEARRLLPR